MVEPPEEAYGRVTNPGRYSFVIDRTEALLDRLVEEHEVERTEGLDLDQELADEGNVLQVVRLAPRPGHGAPLTVGFTSFPGVMVRFGRWYRDAYPHCGCDACDEDPAELVEEMLRRVEALVAGGYSETLTRGWTSWQRYAFEGRAIEGEDFGDWNQSAAKLSRKEARRLGAPGRWDWPPWPRRRAS